jgi:hypothetical protein
MTAVGIWLLSVGVADLVAGLSGEPMAGRRTTVAIASAVGLPVALAIVLGGTVGTIVLVSAVTAATAAGWLVLRTEPRTASGTRAVIALLYLLIVFVALSVISSVATFDPDSVAARALERLPFTRLATTPVEEVVFLAGVIVALFATSNAIVRLVLTAVGTQFSPAEQRLRGGRIIGPIERILIFGLALAGELTAAALVISAKGLLRYPELSGMRAEAGPGAVTSRTIDVVTEYLLIGSLTSWGLALLPLVLVP